MKEMRLKQVIDVTINLLLNSYLESNNARANTTEKILENQHLLCEEAKQ